MDTTPSPASRFLAPLALMWLTCALLVALLVRDPAAGNAARILYVMVPTGWMAILALVAVFLSSAAYLGTRTMPWDRLGHAAAELALLFAGIAWIQGLLLTRATTGTWWAMDARAIGYLIVAIVATACLVARGAAGDSRLGERVAATVGCAGFLVAGVSRAWVGGLMSVRPMGLTRIEAAPEVATQWLCGLAMGAVFAWLFTSRIASFEDRPGGRGAL
jgi:ABC-type transport system involved in cytochrome c biogenesis permease subunit